MLFNVTKERPQGTADCLKCKYFINKKCEGLGKVCFEYEPRTKTMLDPITHLPKRFKKHKLKE